MDEQPTDERIVAIPNRTELERQLLLAVQDTDLGRHAQEKIILSLLEQADSQFGAADIATVVIWAARDYLSKLSNPTIPQTVQRMMSNDVVAAMPKLIEAFTEDPEIRQAAIDHIERLMELPQEH